jgi:hypothetical protein
MSNSPGRDFRDGVLGLWSSHPFWVKQRDRWLRGLSFSALGLLWSIFVARLERIDVWMKNPSPLTSQFLWIAVAATATIAALVTLSICARLSLVLFGPRLKGTSGLDRPKEMAVLLVCVFLGLAAPLAAIYLLDVPPRWQLGMHLLGILPLMALLAALRFAKPGLRPGYHLARQPLWLWIATALAAGAVLSALYDSSALAEPTWLRDAYRRLLAPGALMFWCGPMAAAAWVVWMTSWRLIPDDGGQPLPRRSIWSRLWRTLGGLFGSRTEPGPVPQEPPPWVTSLASALPKGCRLVEGPSLISPTSSSPLVDRPDLENYFGGLRPTANQAAAFDAFTRAYEDVVAAASDPDQPSNELSSSDFLILGPPNSGRKTTLMAYAMFAALVRGQHVLIITATARQASAVASRLVQQLAITQSQYFLDVRCVTEQVVNDALTEDAELPQIWVGALPQIERHLFGAPVRDAKVLHQLSRLISMIEVVLVDDVLAIDDVQRMHLPYTIDKVRLLCEAEMRPLQIVVASRPLSVQGVRLLGEQILGAGYRDAHALALRPLGRDPVWHVRVIADHPLDALRLLAVDCMKRRLETAAFCDGLDERAGAELKHWLLESAPEGRIQIITRGHECLPDAAPAEVLLHVARGQEIAAAPGLPRRRDAPPVVISVASATESNLSARALAVVLDRAAPSFVAAHLDSLHRLLPAAAPIDLTTWLRFGIRPDQLVQAPAAADSPTVELDEYSGTDHAAARSLWGMTAVRQKRLAPRAVDVHFLAAGKQAVRAMPGRTGFFVEPSEDSGARPSLAQWQLENGEPLRQVDLVHESALLLHYESNTFVPVQIEGRSRPIAIVAGHFNGNDSDDAYLPVVDLSFDVPSLVRHAARAGGAQDMGLYWCQLAVEPSPVRVHSGIVGRCSHNGVETPMPRVAFDYAAQLTAIFINPRAWAAESIDDLFSKVLCGSWGTSRQDFDPVLTAAFSAAFAQVIVGLPRFARFVAAQFSDAARQQIGEAVVWLVEPLDTGRSASTAVLELFRNGRHRGAIVALINDLVVDLETDYSVERLRALSRTPTAGDARRQAKIVTIAKGANREVLPPRDAAVNASTD